MNELALKHNLRDMVAEYEHKLENIHEAYKTFEQAGVDLNSACSVGGTYGRTQLDTGRVWEPTMKEALLKSAWYNLYNAIKVAHIMSARDKDLFERSMQDPPPFDLENTRATFGKYLADPRGNILRGLAEVFCSLDQSYKSHDKVKIGVKGLPKRVIIGGLNSFYGHGEERIKDILNALALLQGLPLVEHQEMQMLMKEDEALLGSHEIDVYSSTEKDKKMLLPCRGVWLKRFKNGNGHLYFNEMTLRDINVGLAEFYGDVIADSHEDKPTERAQSTEVAKDLQFYFTPEDAVSRMLSDIYIQDGDLILEPSAGEGHIIDGLMKEDKDITVHGIEFDYGRVQTCKAKGYKVAQANFLDTHAEKKYDKVIMNPPFYGKHYVKHIEHALKFLKEGGTLWSILPITARYDHGILDEKYDCSWSDMPLGSFSEAGTNINTTVVRIRT